MKPIKTITSHAAYSRFLSETIDVGWVDRIPEIPSPYAYSPEWCVMDWNGKLVVARETSHRRYQVFAVPEELEIRKSKLG